jgi:hypothetical protein
LKRGAAFTLCLLACSSKEPTGSQTGGKADFPKSCAEIYNPDELQRFDVEIEADEWEQLAQDCSNQVQQYRPIKFRSGGETVQAMWRLKGNWSWNCEKMQFLISFNEQDPEGRFHGLRKLVLDAPWYDHTLLDERLAFHYLERRGVPYSCVNHARLDINGEYYGVYANVERLDREYLERHFDDPDGNLWKEGRELKTNDETGTSAMVDAFWAARDAKELETLVDIPEALKLWSGLAMLPDPDSYWAGVEINFYLYEHPTRGLQFLPYDADLAFNEDIWPELATLDPITHQHAEWGREAQYQAILSEPKWCKQFVKELKAARSAFDVKDLTARIEEWSKQIEAAFRDDPHATFSVEEHERALAALRDFPARRAAFIDEWLAQGNHCPVSWP